MAQHDSAEITAIVRDHLLDSARWPEPPADLAPTSSLIDSGVLDSRGLMRLIAYLEERFHIVVDDVDILPENFEDLASIARLVTEKARA